MQRIAEQRQSVKQYAQQHVDKQLLMLSAWFIGIGSGATLFAAALA